MSIQIRTDRMNFTHIGSNPFLTDTEDSDEDDDDDLYINVYTFFCSQSQQNDVLREYFWEVGLFTLSDMGYLQSLPEIIQEIYNRLDVVSKKTMNTQYLKKIRQLIKQPKFVFLE
jgi:hypothetical protein